MNDEKIIKGLKNRKRSSLEKAIEKYSAYVNVIVYNIIGNTMAKEDIEEAVSDVFISLWNNAEYINQESGSLKFYIGAIARNKARNKLRELRVCCQLDENSYSREGNPEDELDSREAGKMLYSLIMSLGEPENEIMIRYYYNSEKIREISKSMDINISTVKTKLKRSREKLKAILNERRNGDE